MPRFDAADDDDLVDDYDPLLESEVRSEDAHKRRKGKYKKMGIRQRQEAAYTFFKRGYTNAEVAREIGIHPDTVTRYRRKYDEELQEAVRESPHLLRDVLGNTLRSLQELEEVRQAAWRDYQEASSATAKKGFLDLAIKAQSERAKLFGLMGVKQDTLVYINGIKEVQDKLMDFMTRELCPADRAKLEKYLTETFADQLEGVTTVADLAQS
jgi:transposase-like protein